MSYRVEHTVQFPSLHNKMQVRLDITRLNYKRLSTERVAKQDSALVVEDLEIDTDDKFTAIRGKRISSRLVVRQYEKFGNDYLYNANPKAFKLESYINGSLFASAFYLAKQSDEPFKARPYDFEVRSTVGLGDLKNNDYLDTEGVAYQTKQSAMEILLNCLEMIGLDLPVWVVCESYAQGMDESICPLSQTLIDAFVFYPNDNAKTAYDALQTICTMFGAYICQSGGIWKFVQVAELTNSTVRVWPFQADRTAGYPIQVSIEKIINSGVKVEGRPFISYDQRISSYDPIKLAQIEVEFGELKNRLFNARFQQLDPKVAGGQIARGWREYNTTYSFITPNPRTVFRDNYLKIEGKVTGEDITRALIYVWANPQGGLPFPPFASTPIPYSPYDKQLWISAPVVARYDQIVEASGEYFNVGGKGCKVQLVATPIVNLSIVSQLRANPNMRLSPFDEDHGNVFLLGQSVVTDRWSTNADTTNGDTYVNIFENLKEVREGGDLVNVAKKEWASFSIDTPPLPLKSAYPDQYTYYAVRLVLFRTPEYTDNKPKSPENPYVIYRNLKIGVRNYLDTEDIRKERFEVEQDKPYGIKRDVVTLPLGSVGGENYYSQLLDTLGNPQVNWYKTSDRGKLMPLPALTLTDILKVNGRPTKRVTGSVLHATFDLMDQVKPGGLKGKYMLAGATQNFPSEQSQVVLAELHEYIPSHYRRFYTVNGDGKLVLQDSVYEEGNIPDTEADILITFLEPNGPNGYTITITGGTLYGTQKAHWATLAWFDKTDQGPYTVTVQTLTYGQGFSDYQKIYPAIDHQFQEIEIPEFTDVYVIVENEAGAKTRRKISVTDKQKLHISTPGTACNGDFPAVTGVLQNALPPVKDWRGRVVSFESYTLEVVNLRTGEVIVTTPAPLGFDSKFAVQVPDEWDTDNYGLRITSKFEKDVAGNIGPVIRCKPKDPNWFEEMFEEQFVKEFN